MFFIIDFYLLLIPHYYDISIHLGIFFRVKVKKDDGMEVEVKMEMEMEVE